MDEITFLWDEKKNKANQKKHGVGFEEAKTAFADEYGRLIPDKDHSNNEERFILLGVSKNIRILVVCHCYKDKDKIIRIISARKADKSETKQYRDFRHA